MYAGYREHHTSKISIQGTRIDSNDSKFAVVERFCILSRIRHARFVAKLLSE